MRDLFVLAVLLGSIGLTFRAPWLGVLALTMFNFLSPHRYAWGFMFSFPTYLVLFLAFLVSFLVKGQDRQPLPKDWRVPTFFLLWFYYLVTCLDALVPSLAWQDLDYVSKIYLPFVFTLLLINTREKLFYLIATTAASIGLAAAKGGIWAIGTGFSFRVYGPPGSQIGNNNEFAVVTLMVIPLLILWLRETKQKTLQMALMASIPLCFASAISSQSRGALLTLFVLAPVLVWNSKRRWLAAPMLLIGAAVAAQNLPDTWFNRMDTIETYEEDQSAQGRLRAWKAGINYAIRHPLTGGGFNGWVRITEREWHNSYVQIFAEHGVIAGFLWLSLLVGSILNLTRLARQAKRIPELQWIVNYSLMVRASLIAFAAGTMFVGGAYWGIFYHMVFIAVLIRQFALRDLAEYAEKQALEPAGKDKKSTRDVALNY